MIVSKLKEIGPVTFPKTNKDTFVFMRPFRPALGLLEEDTKLWSPTVDDMMRGIVWHGQSFLYANKLDMKKGEKEVANPGWNVWGNWIENPVGSIPYPGGITHHKHGFPPFYKETIIFASNQPCLEVVVGRFMGDTTYCGGANHLDLDEGHTIQLSPNTAYAMNAASVWRIKPPSKDCVRAIVRIHIPNLSVDDIDNGSKIDEPKPETAKVILL